MSTLTIHVRRHKAGWEATCDRFKNDLPSQAARSAAWEVAHRALGHRNFTLSRNDDGTYAAVEREDKRHGVFQ